MSSILDKRYCKTNPMFFFLEIHTGYSQIQFAVQCAELQQGKMQFL